MAVASVCLAVFFSWLTFLVSGCCLLAPFWMFADSLVSMSVGLYLRCLNPYENSLQDCDWIDITNEIGKFGITYYHKCYISEALHLVTSFR